MEKLYPLMANKLLEEEEKKKGLQSTQPQPTQPIQTRFDIPSGTAEELNTQLQSAQTPPPPAQTGVPQPVSVTPEPAFQFAPQVAVPVTKTQTQTTEKSVVMPPAYGQAQQELDALQPAKQKNLEEAARIGQAAADLENAAIEAKIKADEQNQIKQAELTKKREEEFSRVDADLQAKADAISKHEIKDFFANKSTFSKIMLGIAAGVGQYSSSQTGGPNNAMIIIQNAIDNDFRQQKAVLDKMKSDYDISKGQRGLTQEKYDRAISDLNMTHAQALSKAGDLIKQKAVTQVKKPEIQQQLEANSIALQERAAQMKQVEAEKLKREVIKITQTDQSVQTVGGPSVELTGKAQDYMNKSKPIEKYTAAKDSYRKFKELPDDVAVLNFMVKDMDQGSIPPDMLKLLKKRNYMDNAGNWLRENFIGGQDPELKKELEKSLKTTMDRTREEAKRDIAVVDYLNKSAGMPPSGLLDMPEEQKPNRGVVMRKPK